MSRNLVKFYNATDISETKVIDTNSLMEKKLREIASEARKRPAAENNRTKIATENAEAGFVEGLGAEELESLMNDGEEGAVIKSINPEEEAQKIKQEAQAKADEIVATAEQLAMEYKKNAKMEADIESSRIKADAKALGYQEGLAQAKSEYQDRLDECNQKETQLMCEYDELCQQLESRFVSTITDIYEHVFNVNLDEFSNIVWQLAADTIRKVDNNGTYIVHVSSTDYSNISDSQKEQLFSAAPGCKIDVVEDVGLARSQCLLETDNGVFDCGLDTQLRELRKKLMLLSYTPNSEI